MKIASGPSPSPLPALRVVGKHSTNALNILQKKKLPTPPPLPASVTGKGVDMVDMSPQLTYDMERDVAYLPCGMTGAVV